MQALVFGFEALVLRAHRLERALGRLFRDGLACLVLRTERAQDPGEPVEQLGLFARDEAGNRTGSR